VFTVTFFLCQTIQLLPFAYMSLYVADRRFYIIDVASNLYHPSAYYVAQTLAAIPPALFNGVVLYLVVYSLIGLRNTVWAVFCTGIFAAIQGLVSIQVVALAAYLTPNQDLAFVAGIAYGLLGTLVAGYLVKPSDMQLVLWGISFITPFRYVFQPLLKIQFDGTPDESLLRYMGITMSFGANVGILITIYVVMHLLTYMALHLLHRPRSLKFEPPAFSKFKSSSMLQKLLSSQR
jgi:ABC-2 type transporter